jgi:predicted ATPase
MIEQIIIENYKSIHTAKIPLSKLNVMIGSNGVGKSNFISFFELVQRMLYQNLGSYVLGQGGIERFLYQGSKHSEAIKALIDFNNTNAFFFELKPTIGNKAFIEFSGDYFNAKEDKTKDYNGKWNRTIWDKAGMGGNWFRYVLGCSEFFGRNNKIHRIGNGATAAEFT